jgi:hypothetical protein
MAEEKGHCWALPAGGGLRMVMILVLLVKDCSKEYSKLMSDA